MMAAWRIMVATINEFLFLKLDCLLTASHFQKRSGHSENMRTMGQVINNSKSYLLSTLPWISGPPLLNVTNLYIFKNIELGT